MQYPYLSKALCQKNNSQTFYLANANIYKGKKRLTKNELIEMIITEKPITITHSNKDEEMTKEQAIDFLFRN